MIRAAAALALASAFVLTDPTPFLFCVSSAGLRFHVRTDGLSLRDADAELGRLAFWATLPIHDGDQVRFLWHQLPCALTAAPDGPTFSCLVSEPIGRRFYRLSFDGLWGVRDGEAIMASYRLRRLIIIGADGNNYDGLVSGWDMGVGYVSVVIDDRRVPASAYPYTLTS